MKEKTILKLKLNTDPRWVDIASKNIEDILVDHAYCEQKAASTGISLIIQIPRENPAGGGADGPGGRGVGDILSGCCRSCASAATRWAAPAATSTWCSC